MANAHRAANYQRENSGINSGGSADTSGFVNEDQRRDCCSGLTGEKIFVPYLLVVAAYILRCGLETVAC